MRDPLFRGAIANATTKYVPVPVHEGVIGLDIGWDATANATITLQLTSFPELDAPVDAAGTADEWKASGVAITGPTAAGVGGTQVNIENVRQLRARLVIVTSAISNLTIWDGANP